MVLKSGRQGTFYINTGRAVGKSWATESFRDWRSLPFNALVMGEDCDCGASWTKVAVTVASDVHPVGTHRLDIYHPGDVRELACPSCGNNKGETLVLRNWYVIPV